MPSPELNCIILLHHYSLTRYTLLLFPFYLLNNILLLQKQYRSIVQNSKKAESKNIERKYYIPTIISTLMNIPPVLQNLFTKCDHIMHGAS